MNERKSSGHLGAKYALLQGDYWMVYCSVFSYISVYLLAKGFTAGTIGLLMAWGNIMAAILQPWVASVADRARRFTLKDILLLLAALGLGLTLFLKLGIKDASGSSWQMAATALLFMGIMAVVNVLQPLINAVSGYYKGLGHDMNFGVARGIGSLSFAVLSSLLGWLTAVHGENVIPSAMAVLFAALLAILLCFPMKRREGTAERKDREREGKRAGFYRKYRTFFVLLGGLILIFAFHNMVNTYMIQIMERFGGNSADMGLSLSIAAVCEIPVMFLFSRIAEKSRSDRLLKAAALGFLVKAAAIWLAGNVMTVHISQLLQCCSFAVMIPASVLYADEIMEEGDRVKGQAFVTAAITMGGVLGNLLGGKLIDLQGVQTMLTVGFFCAAAGMAIMWAAAVPAGNYRTKNS